MSENKNSDLLQKLKRATRRAVFVSEIDSAPEPFRINLGPDASDKKIVEEITGRPGGPILTTDVDEFFERLTAKKEWHTKAEELNRRRFARIYRLLTEELTELRVLRAGTIQVDIIVYGVDREGATCGVWMKAVET